MAALGEWMDENAAAAGATEEDAAAAAGAVPIEVLMIPPSLREAKQRRGALEAGSATAARVDASAECAAVAACVVAAADRPDAAAAVARQSCAVRHIEEEVGERESAEGGAAPRREGPKRRETRRGLEGQQGRGAQSELSNGRSLRANGWPPLTSAHCAVIS